MVFTHLLGHSGMSIYLGLIKRKYGKILVGKALENPRL
jgi:hypothetical protein